MNNKISYFYWIDFLRWGAAMAVLLHHYTAHFGVENIIDSNFFDTFIKKSNIGAYGVWFFWCISGFVFTNLYINKETNLKKFTIARIARLYPLHLVTLITIAVLQYYSLNKFGNYQIHNEYYNDIYHFFLNLFLISDWGFQKGDSFNGVIWSVSIEIPVYFIFFFSLKYLRKFQIYLSLSMLLLFKILLHIDTPDFLYHLKACIFFFYFGSTIYFIYKKIEKYKLLFLVLSFLGLICSLFAYKIEHYAYFEKYKNLIPTTLLLFAFLMFFAISLENFLNKIGRKIIFLGNSSYAVYLLHLPIQAILLLFVEFDFIKLDIFKSYKSLIFFFLLIQLSSTISYYYMEAPLRKKIRNLLN